MSEDTLAYNAPSLLVTTDDATLLSCEAHQISDSVSSRRTLWKILDVQGHEYAGPLYEPRDTRDDVRRSVSEWWDAHRTTATSRD